MVSRSLVRWTLVFVWIALPGIAASCGCGAVDWFGGDKGGPEVSSSADMVVAVDGWSGWRGGFRRGVVDEGPLPVRWSESDGTRWMVEIPGRGNSSPVVSGDCVLLTAEVGSGQEAELVVVCLDRADGSVRWTASANQPQGRTHHKNGYASATLAIDGQHVFAFFGSTGLFCFDLQGSRRWRADVGVVDHEWGAASSPVLFGDLVIQLCDNQRESHLSAFDKQTGRLVWRTPRDSRGCWSTPVLAPRDPHDLTSWQLIVNGTGSQHGQPGLLMAYDPATGRELWRIRGTSDISCPTAIVADDWIVSSSNSGVFAVRTGPRGDVTSSSVTWRQTSGGPYVPTGLVYRERLYLVTDGGIATCHQLETGDLLWRKRFRGTFTASLLAGDGKVYAVSEQGDVQVFAAGDEFELLATNRMSERCLATPALCDGELYLRTDRHLYCISGRVEEGIAERSDRAEKVVANTALPSPSDQAFDDDRGTGQDDNL